MAHSLRFENITLDGVVYTRAFGLLTGKPTPATVTATLTIPRFSEDPGLYPTQYVIITALCANGKWMRDITGEVTDFDELPNRDIVYHLTLYRKGHEPVR